MTLGGWLIMLMSVGGTTGLLAWCIHRVLNAPDATKKLHTPADIDTHDTD